MTVERGWGPYVVVGQNAALGTAIGLSGVAGPPAYVSGLSENPDAGPSVFFAGGLFRDMRIFSRPDGTGSIAAGGYPNQDFGYSDNSVLTADFAPAAISAGQIIPVHALTAGVPIPLITVSGAGATLLTAPFTVPGLLNVIPAGTVRIDANPSYVGYGTSGAVQGWAALAAGRVISFTTSATIGGSTLTVVGYDLYGYPQTELIPTIASATTVYSRKAWKWITSVTPSGTSAATVSVQFADIFEFPVRADRFYSTYIVWNNAVENAPAAIGTAGNPASNVAGTWTPADTTSPATPSTGSMRGYYTVRNASDGIKRLQYEQTIPPALVNTVAGVFGVTPV
jgi:hypothetical protein